MLMDTVVSAHIKIVPGGFRLVWVLHRLMFLPVSPWCSGWCTQREWFEVNMTGMASEAPSWAFSIWLLCSQVSGPVSMFPGLKTVLCKELARGWLKTQSSELRKPFFFRVSQCLSTVMRGKQVSALAQEHREASGYSMSHLPPSTWESAPQLETLSHTQLSPVSPCDSHCGSRWPSSISDSLQECRTVRPSLPTPV